MTAPAFANMPPTEKVFHHDEYATRCAAQVLAVQDDLAVFDRSIFYAESGGQVADHGTVSGRRVIDVRKAGGDPYFLPNGDCLRINTYFVHQFDAPVDLRVGDTVEMEIDWERRYQNMQMHSLAHFLFHSITVYLESEGRPAMTKGCYIALDSARFDFATQIDSAALPEIEERVKSLAGADLEAKVSPFDDADDVFMWSCGGIDIPCGGTHVRNSSEIRGDIHVKRRSKGRQGTRVYVTLTRPSGDEPLPQNR